MKTISILFFTILFVISCKTSDINPSDIIGKWKPAYITQNKQADGTFDAWHTINTLVALPMYEFTNDGQFLKNGQPGADCCSSGNNYRVINNEIIFFDLLNCPTVSCGGYPKWIIIEIKGDTLILEKYNIRNKFVKIN